MVQFISQEIMITQIKTCAHLRPESLGFVTANKQPKPAGFVTMTTQA